MRSSLAIGIIAVLTLAGCGATPVPSLPSTTAQPSAPVLTFPTLPSMEPIPPSVNPSTPAPTSPQIETAPPPSAPIRRVDVSGFGSVPIACAGVGLIGATLQGDPNDPRVAWIAINDHGTKGVIFPMGFTARFAPNLEVFDASGQVRFRAGDAIDGGCVWGQNDLLIGWP